MEGLVPRFELDTPRLNSETPIGLIKKTITKTHLVIDVVCVNDFSGDCLRDVRRNGQLRYDDPDISAAQPRRGRQSAEVP